ncbi:choice-of-anchor G family protein [Xylanimonas oleitrophica]|nr:choice-of-anchor G family protein [Xylanimonas oleitrophica]
MSGLAAAPPAAAEPTDAGEALGQFLGGDVVLGNIDLDAIAAVQGANAEHPSGAVLDTNPLSAEVLNTLGVDLTGTLSLLGENGIIELGAVNQYAAAGPASAGAASGAVNDSGAIEVGGSPDFPADATLSLTPLVPAELRGSTVSQLDLTLAAVSAASQWEAGGEPTGDYQVAGATLELTSPLVGGVYSELQGAVAPVQATLDALQATITTALSGLIDVNLGAARSTGSVDVALPDLTTVLPSGFVGDGAVQVNLQTGEVVVDLAQLLAENPDLPDLNELPANYEILSGEVIAAVTEAVTATITSVVEDVAAGVREAVEATTVSVDVAFQALSLGLPPTWQDVVSLSLDASLAEIDAGTATASVDVVGGAALVDILLAALGLGSVDTLASMLVNALLAPVSAVFTALDVLDSALNAITTPLATGVVGPVLEVLTGVVSLTGNVQEQPGDLPDQVPSGVESFTQRALQLRLLSLGTGSDLATVNLASATVRLADAPALDTEPSTVPAGGTTTVTGQGFSPGAAVPVQLTAPDGAAVGDPVTVTVTAEGTITTPLTVPAGSAPGDYTVVATDPTAGDVTAPLAVTDAPTVGVEPTTLPAGGSTTVTGDGYTPGSTATVTLTGPDGAAVGEPVEVSVGPDGTFTVDLPVPADAPAGTYEVTGTDATGAAATTPVAITEARLTADPSAVAPGGTTTVTGDGFSPDTTVTVQITDPDGTPVGDPVTVPTGPDGSFSTDVPLPEDAAPGTWTVVVDDPTGATAQVPVSVVAPTIEATPATVPASGTTTVAGTGFSAGGDVVVQLTDTAGEPLGAPVTVTAAADGTVTTPVVVPAGATPGQHTVVATDVELGVTATTPLTVTAAPEVTVTPGTAPAGGDVEVSGAGFTPGTATVQLTGPDGEPVGAPVTVAVGEDGTVPATQLTVPGDAAPGAYTVLVTDSTDASGDAPLTVSEAPTVTVDPSTVVAGGTVDVTGEGFTPDGDVVVQLTDAAGQPVGEPVTTTADAGGTISTSVTVPAGAAPGEHTVVATDTSGASAEAALTVTVPALTLDPGTVPAGGTTTAEGTGFTPGESVTVQLTDPEGNPVGEPVTAIAGPDGSFTADVPVPADAAPGDHTVIATDNTGATSEAPLQITAAPSLVVDPAQVPAGGATTVNGEGFTPGEPVTVQLTDAAGQRVGEPVTVVTGADGTFSTDLSVPDDATPGQHAVEATDLTGASATTPLTVTDPPSLTATPRLLRAGFATLAAGLGFTPVTEIEVQLVGPDDEPVGSAVPVTTDEDGGFTETVVVPDDAPGGAYTVSAYDPAVDVTVGADLRVVAPVVSIEPDEVPAGGSTTVEGEGFAPDEGVTVEVIGSDGEVAATGSGTADDDGRVSVDVSIPAETAPGGYTVVVTDDATGATSEAAVTVVARVLAAWFDEPVASPGDVQGFHAGGFEPGELVSAVITSEPLTLAETEADADGVAHWVFVVPADFEAGTHTGTATSETVNDSVLATFDVVLADEGAAPEVPGLGGEAGGGPGLGGGPGGFGVGTGAGPWPETGAGAASSGWGVLPRTGADVWGLAALATLLVLSGAAALHATRRRLG